MSTDLSADSPELRTHYLERALLQALAIQKCGHPARIAYNDPNEPDIPVLYWTTPAGQISWHLNPEHLYLFQNVGVPVDNEPDVTTSWDGHDKDQALARLHRLVEDSASE